MKQKDKQTSMVAESCLSEALIQKAYPLVDSLWRKGLPLLSKKIVDLILAKIDMRFPTEIVVLTTTEIEEALGIQRLEMDKFEVAADHLVKKIEINVNGRKTKIVPLSTVSFDEERINNRSPQPIVARINPDFMPFLFNVDNMRYIKHKAKTSLRLKWDSAYELYSLAKMKLGGLLTSSSILTLDEIRNLFNVEEKYESYHSLSVLIKRAVTEINNKTDIKITYIPIKEGGRTAKVRFDFTVKNIVSGSFAKLDDAQNEVLLQLPQSISHELSSAITALREISGEEFTDEELTIFLEIMRQTPDSKLMEGKGIEWYKSYYNHIVNLATRQMKKKKIEDKFSYLKACFENERDERIKQAKKDAPNGNTEGSDEYDLEKYFTASAKAGSDPELDELLRQAAERKYKMLPDTDDSEQ